MTDFYYRQPSFAGRRDGPDTDNNPFFKCHFFNRIPVQTKTGRTAFFGLILCPGNSLASERCGKEQVKSLIRDILEPSMFKMYGHGFERALFVAPPANPFVRMSRHYDPKKMIICLPRSYRLEPDDVGNIKQLKLLGAQFAIFIDAMGDVGSHQDLLACLDYVFIDNRNYEGLMTAFRGLKTTVPNLKSIGFKGYAEHFSAVEAARYDLIFGSVELPRLNFPTRPRWQHVMLRSTAELYSGFYDVKDLTMLSQEYPLIGKAMKGMLASSELLSFPSRFATRGSQGRITQKDMRDLLGVTVAFNLYCLSEKAAVENLIRKPLENFSPQTINTEDFGYALKFGKLVDLFAEKPCDDFGNRQAFLTGLVSCYFILAHDTYENMGREFTLTAPAQFFLNENSSLGRVIKFVRRLMWLDADGCNEMLNAGDFNYTKEQIFNNLSVAQKWTELVLLALKI